jgi:hypothetical protein
VGYLGCTTSSLPIPVLTSLGTTNQRPTDYEIVASQALDLRIRAFLLPRPGFRLSRSVKEYH